MAYDTIEEKLAALEECGFHLKEPFGVSDLEGEWGRESLDEPGFDLALICLGAPEDSIHCDNLWHFDGECIEGDGDYTAIARRMAEMAQGSLLLTDVEDHVDLEAGEAWFRFKCRGKPIHIDCAVDNDWVDGNIFSRFVELLAERDPGKLFLYYDLRGQDCIIGCATRAQFACLQKLIPVVLPLL